MNDSVYILLQFELLMGNGKGGFYSFFKTIFRGFFLEGGIEVLIWRVALKMGRFFICSVIERHTLFPNCVHLCKQVGCLSFLNEPFYEERPTAPHP